jgi:hypothetical protein
VPAETGIPEIVIGETGKTINPGNATSANPAVFAALSQSILYKSKGPPDVANQAKLLVVVPEHTGGIAPTVTEGVAMLTVIGPKEKLQTGFKFTSPITTV